VCMCVHVQVCENFS